MVERSIWSPKTLMGNASLQTASKLYLVLDFVNGGHLFFQLYRQVTPPPPLLSKIITTTVISNPTHKPNEDVMKRESMKGSRTLKAIFLRIWLHKWQKTFPVLSCLLKILILHLSLQLEIPTEFMCVRCSGDVQWRPRQVVHCWDCIGS